MQPIRLQRVKKELERMLDSPPHGISCSPVADDLTRFEAKILGGADTPYHGGVFKVQIDLPERYPCEPPKVQFVTPIYHPNIDSAGRICLDTLKMPPKGVWRPCLGLVSVLTSLQLLMAQPNPDDALMADIAAEFKQSPEVFRQKAVQYTWQHAREQVVQPQSVCDSRQPGSKQTHSTCDSRQPGSKHTHSTCDSRQSADKRPSEESAMQDVTNKKVKTTPAAVQM